MPYKNVFVQNDARIGIKNGQLHIINDNDILIPLEDIATILIESPQCAISSYALGMFAKAGITTIFCDQKRLPCGVLTPMNAHSRQQKMLAVQTKLSKPLKKRLWQKIVMQKILNQACCLEIHGLDGIDKLRRLVDKVDSGDTKNIEALAAAHYFRNLFGKDFTRGRDDIYNAAMNYGYAIIRSMIARHICSSGFVPSIGIHHHSELNNFNLADDLIEPFRALVDCFVYESFSIEEAGLSPQGKTSLFNLVNYEVSISNRRYTVYSGVTEYVKTFISACRKADASLIQVPELKILKVSGDD